MAKKKAGRYETRIRPYSNKTRQGKKGKGRGKGKGKKTYRLEHHKKDIYATIALSHTHTSVGTGTVFT